MERNKRKKEVQCLIMRKICSKIHQSRVCPALVPSAKCVVCASYRNVHYFRNNAIIFLVGYVEKSPWWRIKSLNKEESEKLRGERDQIKFIDHRFERRQVVGFMKARRRQDVP